MSDAYIRRSAAIDLIRRHIGSLHTSREESLLAWVVGALQTMPAADVVPVQRCGNCKHMRPSVDVHTGEVVDHWCNLYDYDGIAADSLCLKWAQAMDGGDGHAAD